MNDDNLKANIQMIAKDGYMTHWSPWITNVTGHYLDNEATPLHIDDILAIQINPIEDKHIGRLVPNKLINHTEGLLKILQKAEIDFYISGGIIVIKFE